MHYCCFSNGYKERDVLGFYIHLPTPKPHKIHRIMPPTAKDMVRNIPLLFTQTLFSDLDQNGSMALENVIVSWMFLAL